MRSIILHLTAFSTLFIVGCVTTNQPNVSTKSPVEIKRSGIEYSKPQLSSQVVKGKRVEYELWFDKKWQIVDPKSNDYKFFKEVAKENNMKFNHLLFDSSGEIFVITQESRIPNTLEAIAIYDSKEINLMKGNITNQEIRSVNGSDVLYIKYDLTAASIKWVYLNYYLSNKTGAVRVVCYTADHLFAEHESDMINLLNGLVDPHSEAQPQSDGSIETKLLELKNLMNRGLITQDDYDNKKATLLNNY